MVYTLDTMTGEELKHARLRLEMTQKELGDENNQQAWLSSSNFSLLKDDKHRFVAGVESNGSTTLQMFGKEKEEMKLTSFGLLFRDKAGKHRLMAGADRDGGSLHLFGETSRIDLGVEKRQELALTTLGVTVSKNDKPRLIFALKDDGDPGLMFTDKYGRGRFTVGLSAGAPLITMEDEYGKIIWSEPIR